MHCEGPERRERYGSALYERNGGRIAQKAYILRLSGLFSLLHDADTVLYIKFFEFFNQLGLLIRIEVRVRVKRSFYILVTKPLGDKQRRKAKLN